MNTTAPYATAYVAGRTALRDALAFADSDLTPEAHARRRADMIRAARTQLAAATPVAPRADISASVDVLAQRSPRTADDIALQAREREKVQQLLDAGQPLGGIIANASELRVAAVLDAIETLPVVLASGSPETVADELRAAAFSRLVELGAPDALTAAAADTEAATVTLWSQALTEAQAGEVSIATRQAIYAADLDGYREAFSDDVSVNWGVIEHIEAASPAPAQ